MIKSVLSSERKPVQSLRCGVHRGVFYLGTTLPQGQDAVVTSDRNIFVAWNKGRDEIKEIFGLNYRFSFDADLLDGHFSINAVRRWMEGEVGESLASVYKKVLANNKKYIYLPSVEAHEYVALDILSTYFLAIFEAKGRTLMIAEQGSGKTRQGRLYTLQACNTLSSPDITKAAFFRAVESTCCTLIIDDFDSVGEDQKLDIVQHFKTGYKLSGKTLRVAEHTRRIEAFHNFGHVVLNGTLALDTVSADRAISLPLIKYDGKATKKDIVEGDPYWSSLRDACFLSSLTFWQDVKIAYDGAQSRLRGRSFELARPVLTLAHLIDTKLFLRITRWLESRFQEAQLVDLENDWFYLALKKFKDLPNGESIPLSEIVEHVATSVLDTGGGDFVKKKRGIAIYLGRKFSSVPLFRPVYVHGKREIKLPSRRKLEQYLHVKGWDRVGEGGTGRGKRGLASSPKTEDIGKPNTTRPTDDELCWMIQDRGNRYPLTEFAGKFGDAAIQRLKNRQQIIEMPAGYLQVLR